MSNASGAAQAARHDVDICIISAMHPSLNPRVVKEADALSEAGFSVGLIAPDYAPTLREMDRALLEAKPWRILARPRFGPHAPTGLRVAELARRAAAEVAVGRLGFAAEALQRAYLHPVAPALAAAAARVRARLYSGHLVPGLAAASYAARRQGAPYAFDAEDFHPGDLPDTAEHAAWIRAVRRLESRALPGAAYVTAASPLIARAYAQAYGIAAPTTILNVFPRDRAPSGPTPRGWAHEGPSVYWVSQTIGPDRGLECLIEAVGRSRARPQIHLRGAIGAESYARRLRGFAAEKGVADRLHFAPLAPPDDMARLAAAHDLGFVGEVGRTPNRKIMLTNKQFTYFLAGVPAVMSDIPSHRAFAAGLEPAATLFRCEEPDDLARGLDALLCDPERLAAARRAAFRLGQERFNWDREKQALQALARGVLGAAAPAPGDDLESLDPERPERRAEEAIAS
ncbi:MAG: hypothetical protein AAGM38_03220 [Pseudomonadota bacterium]